jgi:REP element-mobilizing transposase RayT
VPKRSPQTALALIPQFAWGGARDGAGRKPRGPRSGISHARQLEVDRHSPVHVTLRVREHVWNLRSRRCYAVFAAALRGVLARPDFRVVHFSLLGNHVHLVVEADDSGALARGMRALTGSMAMRLNVLMRTRGRVFADRYHAHVLRTPAEVSAALSYVLGNFASHARRRGEPAPDGFVDPYSSAAERGPDGEPPPVSAPRSWLLRSRGELAREPVAEYRATPARARHAQADRAEHRRQAA